MPDLRSAGSAFLPDFESGTALRLHPETATVLDSFAYFHFWKVVPQNLEGICTGLMMIPAFFHSASSEVASLSAI